MDALQSQDIGGKGEFCLDFAFKRHLYWLKDKASILHRLWPSIELFFHTLGWHVFGECVLPRDSEFGNDGSLGPQERFSYDGARRGWGSMI